MTCLSGTLHDNAASRDNRRGALRQNGNIIARVVAVGQCAVSAYRRYGINIMAWQIKRPSATSSFIAKCAREPRALANESNSGRRAVAAALAVWYTAPKKWPVLARSRAKIFLKASRRAPPAAASHHRRMASMADTCRRAGKSALLECMAHVEPKAL